MNRMFIFVRRIGLLAIILVLLVMPAAAAKNSLSAAQRQNNDPIGKVTLPLGKVTIQPAGSEDWDRAKVNQAVFVREKVKTLEKSRCEITLEPKKLLRIGEQSRIILVGPAAEGANMFNIEAGRAWFNMSSKKKQNMRVRTPTAVAAIRGTVFRIDCDVNHSTFSVYTGAVGVTPLKADGLTLEDTTFTIAAGNVFTIISNFEEYMQQQYKEMEQFRDQEKRDFEKFSEQQTKEFQDAVNAEKKAFAQYKSQYYSQANIDLDKERKSDLVRWNKERYLLLY